MRLRDQNGAVAIEFAVVTLFILVPLLLGTTDLAFAIYNQQVITNASREGARAGSSWKAAAAIDSIVQNYCAGRLISGGTLSSAVSGGGAFQNDLTVTVSYEHHFLFAGIIGLSQMTLTGTTVMKMEPLSP